MGKSYKWTKQFGISDQHLAEIEAQAATDDLLRWCLMNGKVAESEYMKWAMQNYGLPMVNGDFFTAPADLSFWDRVKDLHAWHEGFYPLAEWQGTFLIACIEPPQEFRFKEPHSFVLASPRNLMLLWSRFQNSDPALPSASSLPPSSLADSIAASPSGMVASSPPAENPSRSSNDPNKQPVLSLESLISESGTFSGSLSDFGADLPSGLSLASTSKTFDALRKADLAKANTAPVLEVPDGLAPLEKTQPPSIQFTRDIFKSTPEVKKAIEQTASSKSPEDNTLLLEEESETATSSPESQQFAKSRDPAAPSASDDEPTKHGVSRVFLRPVESTISVDDLGAVTMTHALRIFNGVMIFMMQENQTLKPWKWTDLLTTPLNSQYSEIFLEDPSIFRIVYRTGLPYHGYVTPSDVNTAFFNAYHNGKLPPHVTVAPIVADKLLIGMLMGIAGKDVKFKESLVELQHLADEVGKQLLHLRKQTQAA